MTRASRIETWLKQAFEPSHLEVLNESHTHNVPAGSESHFRLVVVSTKFEAKSMVERHRMVYAGLQSELGQPGQPKGASLHALSLQLFSPAEWSAKSGPSESPACAGGDGSLPKRRP